MPLERFKEAAFFLRHHLFALMAIFLVPALPLSWLPKLSDAELWQQPLNLLLLETVLGGLAGAAGLLYIHRQQSEQSSPPWACYALALRRIGPIVLLALISNFLVLTGLSLLLPGLFLMYCFMFAEIELVLNNESPLQALILSGRRALKCHRELLPAFTAFLGGLWLLELIKRGLYPEEGAEPGLILLVEPLAQALLLSYLLPLVYRIYQCNRQQLESS